MKITESKLRQMIRGVIREFTSSATAAGAEKKGFQSKTRKAAQSDYDTKTSDYETKTTDYTTKKSAVDALASTKFRKSDGAGGYDYFSTLGGKGSGRSTNPAWQSANSEKTAAERNRDAAETTKNTANRTLDTAKERDLKKTVPTQKPPSGGGAGFGKGKAAGKGKGKGKK